LVFSVVLATFVDPVSAESKGVVWKPVDDEADAADRATSLAVTAVTTLQSMASQSLRRKPTTTSGTGDVLPPVTVVDNRCRFDQSSFGLKRLKMFLQFWTKYN
jgi:hypothetical protein